MGIASLTIEVEELGFPRTVFGRRRLYLAQEIAAHAAAIDRFLSSTNHASQGGLGNRASAFPVVLEGLPPMFVRRYLRGGLMRLVASELYAGRSPRPLRELTVTAAARRRGLPVVEPLGAIVEAVGPCLYRGWFLTRALEGVTLWNLLLGGCDAGMRREAFCQARASIDRLHEGGLFHADLNFHNLLVRTDERPLRVVVLDLDKARLHPAPLAPALRQGNFSRLKRSARRLGLAGANLTADELGLLGIDSR